MKPNQTALQKGDFVALTLLVLMLLWFTHEIVGNGKIPFFRDLGFYFYPISFSVAESLKASTLPLWNRHMAMGFPLMADFQSAAFYPPTLIYAILPFFAAVGSIFLLHYLIAATGAYALCRRWNYPPYLAIVGAILFTLGGVTVSLTNLLNHFQTSVWLPWVVLAWEECLQRTTWRSFLSFSLVSLLQFLAGSPEFYLMSMMLLLPDSVRVKSEGARISYKKMFGLFIGANLLIAGLAAIQIVPTAELVLESRMQKPVAYSEASAWSLHPWNLVNLFYLDKEVDLKNLTSPLLFFLPNVPFFLSYYLGAFFLLSFLLWLFYESKKRAVVLVGLVLLSLIPALGIHTPGHAFLFDHIPYFRLVRFPEKFFFITNALLIFVVLRGFFYVSTAQDSGKALRWVILPICLLLFLLYFAVSNTADPVVRFLLWLTNSAELDASVLKKSASILAHLERLLVLTLGISIILLSKTLRKLRAPLFNLLIVVVVFIDLSSAHRAYQFLLDPSFVVTGSRAISAPDPSFNRLFYYPNSSNLHPSVFRLPREPSLSKFNSLVFDNLLPNTGVIHGFDYMQELDALGRWPYAAFLDFANKAPPEKQFRLLGSLNVKYIVSLTPLPEKGVTLLRHSPEHPSWLYAVDDLVSRSYIAAETEVEKNPKVILERLSNGTFDAKKTVILDRPFSLPSNKNFQAQAKIVRYENQTVIVQASLNGPGVLVLADSYYPGWKAYVNGKEEEILRANLFFRAIPLPAGEHRVEFRYKPLSFKIGLIISLITLSGLVVFSLGLCAWKKRQSRPTESR